MPVPTVDRNPPALAGMHWFGVVQYVGLDRIDDWIELYRELFVESHGTGTRHHHRGPGAGQVPQ